MDIIAAIRRIVRETKHKLKYPKKAFGAIGKGCIIGEHCSLVPPNMYLGDYVMLQDHTNFISHKGRLVVKKYSVISSSCVIVPSTHLAAPGVPFYYQAKEHCGDEDHTIEIDEDCWVGARSILLPKSRLGRGCIVAAGSVVSKPVPPYAVVGGVPAKIIGVKFDKEDVLLHESRIYPPQERMSREDIDRLYETFFTGMKPMKKCDDAEVQAFRDSHPHLSV